MPDALILLVALIAAAIVGFRLALPEWDKDEATPRAAVASILLFGGGIGAIVWTIIIIGIALDTNTSVNNMESFYNGTLSAYRYHADQLSGSIVIDPEKTRGEVDLYLRSDDPYKDGLKKADKRLEELREKVEWFNNNLYSLRNRNSWFLFGSITRDVPEYLKPIELESAK